MAKGSKHMRNRKTRLSLRVERLEPRMVLSSLGLAVPGAHFGPPLRDALSTVFDASSISPFGSLKSALAQGPVARQAGGFISHVEPIVDAIALHTIAPSPASPSQTRDEGGQTLRPGSAAEGGMVRLELGRSLVAVRQAGSAIRLTALRSWNALGDSPVVQTPLGARDNSVPTGTPPAGEDRVGPEDGLPLASLKLADAAPPPDGGWIEFGNSVPARRPRTVADFRAMGEALSAQSAAPGGPAAAHDFALMDPVRSGAPVVADQTSGTASPMLDSAQSSKAAAITSGVTPAALPVQDSTLAADRSRGWVAPSYETAAIASEGGLIELDVAPRVSPSLAGRAEEAPAAESLGRSEPRDVAEPLGKESDREDASRQIPRVAADEAPRWDALPEAENTREELSRASDSAEGGMVELAMASADSPRIAEWLPAAANGGPFVDVTEVRMDNGVALYQAFELATAVPQRGEGNEAAFLETDGIRATSDAVVPIAAPVSPSAGEAAVAGEKPRGDSVSRSGTVRTVLVASFIASAGVRGGLTLSERRRSRSAGTRGSEPKEAG